MVMGTLIAVVLAIFAGGSAAGLIIIQIPNMLFRGGDDPSSFDKQSKTSSFLEWLVFVCLLPIGILTGAVVDQTVFNFLTL